MKVNSNIQAMIAGNVLRNNEIRQSESTERLSSGYRLNHAKDNPAGMAISNKMRAQIASLNKANQNASNAVNVIETAEGALSEIQDMVQRISELSVKAANGTNTEEDRAAIQKEIDQLTKEIERVARDTEYNTQNLLGGEQQLKGYALDDINVSVIDYDPDFEVGKAYNVSFDVKSEPKVDENNQPILDEFGDPVMRYYIDENTVTFEKDGNPYSSDRIEVEGDRIKITNLDGSTLTVRGDLEAIGAGNNATTGLDIQGVGGMKIQVGSAEGQEVQVVIPKISLDNLGLTGIDVRTETGAKEALDQAKNAISFISSVRSRLGAYQNRFENTISNLDVATENLTKSFSTIKDTDMADEMVDYTTLQVLVQAGTSMLSQANEQPQQALQLLQ